MASRFLIVNADDYGLTAGVSAGIRQAHAAGHVTSTTAMINFPPARAELARARQESPSLGLGLHLVASAGGPVRPAARVASLLRPDGSFARLNDWSGARWDAIDIDQLRDEWRAQADEFMAAAGQAPDHLDSHHHLSYGHPKPLAVMLDLAAELGVPVRDPRGLKGGEAQLGLGDPASAAAINALAESWAAIPHPAGLVSNRLGSGRTVGDALVRLLPEGAVVEAMCHPGRCDDALRAVSSYCDARAAELDDLTRPGLAATLAARGIQLATFAALSG
ncbi:carbohydrate deacetylase [Magnetospirillum sp. UT-4]|uniref:carbohydrate deacetylase n=1 Tax=Magnetospirillum sp. UT-4 TaxID=2681467 RepID=UPI00138467A5|nr:ChbG/HpnK family deacetylase [Magnetospirillum sp. UT-4]CAA7612941.1 conserved hypothetical protein [Magnetospirillum sp. UT-4]